MTIKLIIVGGVAGGATAAARARRLNEQAEIILFERGEYISFANCGLPYHIGGIIEERDALLVTTEEAFSERYHIDIRSFSEVTTIDKEKKQVTVQNLKSGETYTEGYDKLILSPGAEPLWPPIDGIELENIFKLRNIPDTDRIKSLVDNKQPSSAVVVGGGFIGLEMAENLVHRNVKVTVIEMLNQVMAPLDLEMASMVQEYLAGKGIDCNLDNRVTAFVQEGEQIRVKTENGSEVVCDMVLMSAGIRPENKLAVDAGLEIGQRGGIIVDACMQTSNPHIFAVGDAIEVRDFVTGFPVMIPLAGPANKQGRIAADNVMGRRSVYKGTQGTSILKLFDMTVASTGVNEKNLSISYIPHQSSYTFSNSHASYYPGATEMAIKLIFTPGIGKILGAQIVGQDGVDKRIDVLATAIRGSMTVYDLEDLELAYAPPYSSAKDPVNVAGFVSSNILKGDLNPYYWQGAEQIDSDTDVVIDLRNPIELKMSGKIDGALNIPLDDLRERLPKLDRSKNYILTCAVGLRGYIGYRIMSQHGFKVKSACGGYSAFKHSFSQ
jgi:NADPH-dependent 2,4-dienoyl-CoA reductase/sulfur reductase-like enzyme/rhodanese-related sulfurtransferase